MWLARLEFGKDVQVYEVVNIVGAELNNKVDTTERVWKFEPKLGGEGDSRASNLCSHGIAAIAKTRIGAIAKLMEY